MQRLVPARALAAIAFSAALLSAVTARAADTRRGEAAGAAPAAGAAATPDKPYGDWKKLTRDADVVRGFFTLYRKRENL